jgi:hypothetical protein
MVVGKWSAGGRDILVIKVIFSQQNLSQQKFRKKYTSRLKWLKIDGCMDPLVEGRVKKIMIFCRRRM